jgi:hypothetical protein
LTYSLASKSALSAAGVSSAVVSAAFVSAAAVVEAVEFPEHPANDNAMVAASAILNNFFITPILLLTLL